jgi:tetratricopeptide (TPR) repeat protein
MRIAVLLLILLVLAFPAFAQSASEQVLRAKQLQDEGQPKAAIAILEPLTRQALAENELAVAWDLLASSYQDLEMLEQAKAAYENAIAILRLIPTARAQYAAVMEDLASVEGALGQEDSAKALSEKSMHVYEALGNSAGIAITSTSLAMMAAGKKDFKAARRSLAIALREAQHTNALRDDDIAEMNMVKGALALHDGRYEEAISTVQQSMDVWTRAHGPAYVMLGAGFALRAQAVAKSGDYTHAIEDAQHALAIIEAKQGKNCGAYFVTEMAYAQILRAAGQKQQAAELQKQAGSSLADLASRQCRGCTINAYGFR